MRNLRNVLSGMAASTLGVFLLVAAPVARAQDGRAIRCESTHAEFNRCAMPWSDAELARQESKGACIRGQSWGVDRQGLWVDRGCRGVFVEARQDGPRYDRPDHRGPTAGWRPGPDWNRQIRLQCDSHGNSYQLCEVDVGRRGQVRLVKRMSDARCVEGSSWGWNRAGVWVDRGCRAQFVVDRRW